MPDRDYSQRDVLDKLGIRPGHRVVFDERGFPVDPALKARVLARAGKAEISQGDNPDVVLATVNSQIDIVALLAGWKLRIDRAGGIWLITPKRGKPGYVNQNDLIAAGLAAGLVDNKACSVSDDTSGLRFVIRKSER
jgi:hypothetical protein